ncbi:MAG: PAS domain S-box protein [Deltaproteobacteria bacterium]|nr:MAG: PAS domain S-box protein [Deltaproteobacteria bacterium]
MAEGRSEIRLSPSLRGRIERFLAAAGPALEEFPPLETQKLVSELYVHQMELHLRNEELRRKQVVVQRFLHRQEEIQSEERFRSMAQTAIDAVISTDERGRIISWNQGAQAIFGYQEDEVLDQHLAILFPERYRAACRRKVERRRFSGMVPFPGKAMELHGLRQDGGEFPLELSLSRWEAGANSGYTAIIRDISKRWALTLALEGAAHKWRTTFDAIGDGVFLLNLDYEILQCNHAMSDQVRKPFGEIIGRRCHKVVHRRSSPIDGCPFVRMKKSRRRETLILRRDDCWFKIAVDPILDDDGNLRGGVHVTTDITTMMLAQEALKETLARLKRNMDETVAVLAATAGSRDPYTAGHQHNVAQLACAIAREMGLSPEQFEGIRVIGLLHDIGKVAVPAELLSKPGKLSELEFGIIKSHSLMGYEILKRIEFPWPVALAVLQHHERLDGSGYPGRLPGAEICLEAKIIAVADVVEAMSSHRPYRSSLGIDRALEEIFQGRGVCYDPEIVDACISLFTQKGFSFGQEPFLILSPADETGAAQGGPGPGREPAAVRSEETPVQKGKSAAKKSGGLEGRQ